MSDNLFAKVEVVPKNPELRFQGENARGEKISAVFVRHEAKGEIQCRAAAPGTHSWKGYREYKIGRVDFQDIAAYLGCDAQQLEGFVTKSKFNVN